MFQWFILTARFSGTQVCKLLDKPFCEWIKMHRMKAPSAKIAAAYSQAPWRNQVRTIGLFSLGLVFIGLVAGIYLMISANTVTVGREHPRKNNAISRKNRREIEMKSQLAHIQSAENILQTARAQHGVQTRLAKNCSICQCQGTWIANQRYWRLTRLASLPAPWSFPPGTPRPFLIG